MTQSSKPIRLAIDALGIHEVGGARSVSLPLLERVFQMKADWQFYCYLTRYEQTLDFPNVKQILLPFSKGMLSRIAFQVVVPFTTLFYQIDLTHFIKSQASLIPRSRKVLTIFDCTILKYPQYFGLASRLYWRYIQPWMCRRMDRILTISQDARAEIMETMKVPPEKIAVIYPAPQFDTQGQEPEPLNATLREKYNLPRDYLLYIGQIGLKKNLDTIIKAYRHLQERIPTAPPLVLAGPRYYLSDAGQIFDTIDALGLNEQVRYLGVVDKDDLQRILGNALALLFPSVHEGFGIPIVEAMAMGVPVITSNTSVMPEVVADAGILVDDFLSPPAWAEAISTLLTDPQLHHRLALLGRRRAADFSWDKSAEALIHIYEDLL